MMDTVHTRARRLLTALADESASDLLSQADELLLFLNQLADASKKHRHYVAIVNPVKDIIHGLESNPQQTLRRSDVRARLISLFTMLLQKTDA